MATIQSPDDLIYRIFHVRQTAYKMLKNRGYAVLSEDIRMTLDEFKDKYVAGSQILYDELSILTEHLVRRDKIFVRYVTDGEKRISSKIIDEVVNNTKANHPDLSRLILILVGENTSLAKTALEVTSSPFIIEYFKVSELVVDITEHELVPEHTVLTPEESKALLDQYGLKKSQLPRLMKRDPIARYFGLQKDDIVRITRRSETAGKYVTYRIVDV